MIWAIDKVLTSNDNTVSKTVEITKNFAIEKSDVVITPIEAFKVESAELVTENGVDKIVINFSNAVNTTTAAGKITEGVSPNAFNGSVDLDAAANWQWSNGNKTLTIDLVNGQLNINGSATVSLATDIKDVNGLALTATTLTIDSTKNITVGP